MGQIAKPFAEAALKCCQEGKHPSLTVWETQQLLWAWLQLQRQGIGSPSAMGELPPVQMQPAAYLVTEGHDTGCMTTEQGELIEGYEEYLIPVLHQTSPEDDPLFTFEQLLEYGQLCQQGGGWLPIESAPKDGTEIIVLDGYYFANDAAKKMHFMLRAVYYQVDEDVWVTDDGEVLDDEPSYWLPRNRLPAPPQPTEKEG